MGLLDELLSGAVGGNAAGRPAQSGGGMSPTMMALMAMMAYRALSGGGAQAAPNAPGRGTQQTSGNPLEDILGGLLGGAAAGGSARGGGGLGDILGGMLGGGAGGAMRRGMPSGAGAAGGGLADVLGGLLAGGAGGGALGNVLNGGLGDILKQLQESGRSDVADSWVGTGKNKPISPQDLDEALGPEKMKSLAEQAGLSHVQFMQGLAVGLPQVIDRMTPDGRMPTRAEAERWV